MSDYIITIEQIEDLVMQSSAKAIDAYKLDKIKWKWQYPLLPEIIRCKDCCLQDDYKYCERLGFKVGDYGYCAWGERK